MNRGEAKSSIYAIKLNSKKYWNNSKVGRKEEKQP